jgi:hypothetical protein
MKNTLFENAPSNKKNQLSDLCPESYQRLWTSKIRSLFFRVKLLTTASLFNNNNMFGVAVDRH